MKWRNNDTNSLNLLTSAARLMQPLKKIPFLPILLDEQVKLYTFFFHPGRFMKMQELCRVINEKLKLETSFHRYGGIDFRYKEKEIAHLHSNGLLDIHFPKPLAEKLIEKGMTSNHHIYPGSGWTTFRIKGNTNIESIFKMVEWSFILYKKEMTVADIIEIIKKPAP